MKKRHKLVLATGPALAAMAALSAGTSPASGTSPAAGTRPAPQTVLAATRAAPGPGTPAPRPGTATPAPIHPVTACAGLASIRYDFSQIPGAPVSVLAATQSGRGAGAICHVTGYIAPQEQFQLALPVNSFTGGYLQSGCGGLCGWSLSAGPAAGCPDAAGLVAATGNQIAGGTDNQGHVGGENDALWAKEDPALRVSFGYASEHALDRAARAIITAYYGRPPAYSFYDGCSDGGHESLTEAQRYPDDFNAILAGAPGMILTEGLSEIPAWLIAANTGAHGHEILDSQKLPALHAAVLRACGNASGLIEDPRSCGFNPATMRCPAGVNQPSCLTAAQVRVVRDFYLGPNDGHGHYLYPGGEPYGSELEWAGTAVDPAADHQWPRDTKAYQAWLSWLANAAYWHNPPASFRLSDFRFTVASYRKLLPLAGIYDATDPGLSAFRKAGGKLILWQGWADQEAPPTGTVDYYRAVVRHSGGFAASQAFSRLYMIPDQYHCLDGGFPEVNGAVTTGDLLTSLIRWTEHGTAPGTFSFPLAHPAGGLRAITVHPLNPLAPPPGGARGLNTRNRWVGRFRTGSELWCRTDGMDLVCRHTR